jgi:hypothetical protein
MKKLAIVVTTAVLVGAPILSSSLAIAQTGPPVIQAEGGGTATFDDGREPNTTPFGLAVNIREDGTAMGHWMCLVPNIVVVSGHITMGMLNGDGSVTFGGLAEIDFIAGPRLTDIPFHVTVWAGGPGIGRFLFEVPVFGVADAETVETGVIAIKTK